MTRATELVVVENFQALTTSLKIAEAFEKDHAHVMRDIHTLIQQMASNQEKPILDSAQMFQESSYRVEGQLRKYPMFLLTLPTAKAGGIPNSTTVAPRLRLT